MPYQRSDHYSSCQEVAAIAQRLSFSNTAPAKPVQDMAVADKEKVAAEIAAMDPAVKRAIEEAAAAARTAKKQSKTDKAAKVGWLLLRTYANPQLALHAHGPAFVCPYAPTVACWALVAVQRGCTAHLCVCMCLPAG